MFNIYNKHNALLLEAQMKTTYIRLLFYKNILKNFKYHFKAIKYGIWTSTPNNNPILEKAWE